MAELTEQGLVSLGEGGWEVAEDEPDVRGWDVLTTDLRKVGDVDDLLADPTAMKVRYLTIDLEKDVVLGDTAGNVRVPISRARVHEAERKVALDVSSAELTQFAAAAPNRRVTIRSS